MQIENPEAGSPMQPVGGKIGGASLSTAEDIKHHLVELIKKHRPTILVVSALEGVTNQLEKVIESLRDKKFEEATRGFVKILFEHHSKARKLGLNEKKFLTNLFRDFKQQIFAYKENSLKQEDVENFILATGEIVSSWIVWRYLQKEFVLLKYVDAREVIFLQQNSNLVNREKTRKALIEAIEKKHFFVMAGFIASGNRNLGRNGSDTTLALVAYAHKALGQKMKSFYFKAEKFDMSNLKEEKQHLSFGQFRKAMVGRKQPYIHEDALNIHEEIGGVVEVRAKNDPNFRLTISTSKFVSPPPAQKAVKRFAE